MRALALLAALWVTSACAQVPEQTDPLPPAPGQKPLALAIDPRACGVRADLVRALAGLYDERPVARGLTSSGALLEVFTSKDGTTWTLTLSVPDGLGCALLSGSAWQPSSGLGS